MFLSKAGGYLSVAPLRYFPHRIGSWDRIHKTSFSSYFKYKPSKLKCYTSLKVLTLTNTVTYWTNLKVMKKTKCCECGPWDCIHNTSFCSQHTNWSDKLERYNTPDWKGSPQSCLQTSARLEQPAREKYSGLSA